MNYALRFAVLSSGMRSIQSTFSKYPGSFGQVSSPVHIKCPRYNRFFSKRFNCFARCYSGTLQLRFFLKRIDIDLLISDISMRLLSAMFWTLGWHLPCVSLQWLILLLVNVEYFTEHFYLYFHQEGNQNWIQINHLEIIISYMLMDFLIERWSGRRY